MQRRVKTLIKAFMIGSLMIACAPVENTDDDDTCSRAKPLPPGIMVKDELKVSYGDRSDCKQVRYFKDAIAKVEIRIGSAFERHNIKGLLTVYDGDGQVVDQKAVDPSVFKYPFEFDVIAGKPYYLEFKATEGEFPYSAEVKFIKKDPCAKCSPEEECIDAAGGGKECRKPELTCSPECDEEEGMVCVEGECVTACNPECRKGYSCDAETRECTKERKTCSPRCQRDEYCSRRSGRCYPRKAPSGKCAGGCKPGLICKGGTCLPPGVSLKCPSSCPVKDVCSKDTGYKCRSTGPDLKTGPIVGRVASTVRSGQGTILYLNRGTRHGVQRSKAGKLCGKHRFVVTNAFATRSKARTNASIEEIGDCKSVTIAR